MPSARVVVGKRLRDVRKTLGLSQEQVGHRSSVTPSYVGAIERAARGATIDTLERLCKGLGVTLGEVVAHEELALTREVESLIADVPSRLRPQMLKVIREVVLLLRVAATDSDLLGRPMLRG